MAARADPGPARRGEGPRRTQAEGGPAAAADPAGVDAIHLTATQPAPAKVNLYLHVGAPGPDGYHPISSLAAFGAVADRIELRPADAFSFAVEGPFGAGLEGEGDNLVVRAAHAIARLTGEDVPPAALTLHKATPVAAGLGGGSSDAAAALRLLRDRIYPGVADADLLAILAELGADGPMCLEARPVIAEGRGDRLSPPPVFPDLPVVLVNPRVECATAEIYRAYDAAGRFGGEARGVLKPAYAAVGDLARDLAACRNDLEPVARARRPEVGQALDRLAAEPETLLARMSGSGATCFALCADGAGAERVRDLVAATHPGWWAVAGILSGRRP